MINGNTYTPHPKDFENAQPNQLGIFNAIPILLLPNTVS
jgi:hypothetical protein